ncbi:MAG TPA: D-alanyl-D-alanine carboxypeptidase family protein [Alphaproteobacteria bacterium]|nr:D-alanyl-D-alanine carboxypeptidase family protein [Alphaproteobacteria bacterium]HJO88184.1 D-alanyl-D-alanine carboxypeptidase family protein [Alphaproteobacteria bacterium]
MTYLRLFVYAMIGALLCLAAGPVAAVETQAKQAILADFETGSVLFEKNADESMAPSSMSKLMTIYMVFERLRDGRLSLEDKLPVSTKAWRKGGSKMFVKEGDRVSIEDLIRGVVVQSGNDACIVIAEGLAGSEEIFAEEMTERGRELGLENTVFKNATGWPDLGHTMTARDLAILTKRTVQDFPEYFHYYAEKNFTYNGIHQSNRNPLLYKNLGADGLKTGHTELGKFGLVVSAERKGRRLILVLNGLPNVRTRSKESERLLEWGFREFNNYKLFSAGETVTQASVWLGDVDQMPLVVENDLVITIPKKSRRKMQVSALFEEPVPTPIRVGQQIALLQVSAPGFETLEVPLVAGEGVGQLGLLGRLASALNYLIWGSLEELRQQ